MKKLTPLSRRRFLGSSAVISGAALGASSLPLSAAGIARPGKTTKLVKKAPLFDPAFENYPGYSARIPAPSIGAPTEESKDTLFGGMQ